MQIEIAQVIQDAGGIPAVAKQLGINPVSVYEWIGANRLPPKRVISVASLTGWKYTPNMLDAQLYPNPNDGLPSELAE